MQVKKVRLMSCLALVASLAFMAAPAFAQGVAFQSSSLPQQVRFEGVTETVGAVVLQATGTGTIPINSSITIVYSGTITNSLDAHAVSGAFKGTPCGAGACASDNGTAVFGVSPSGNQLTISVSNTGTNATFIGGDYIVISQVRINVNALGSGTSTVTATLSGTSATPTTNPITFTNSSVPVASVVNPSINVTTTASTSAIQTCSVSVASFSVTVAERYPAAFTSFTDESNFTPSYTPSNGTSLAFTVTGVPNGFAVSYTGPTNASGTAATYGAASSAATQLSSGSPLTFTIPILTDNTSAVESTSFGFSVGVNTGTSSSPAVGSGSITPIGTTVTVTANAGLAGVSGKTVNFAANSYGGGNVLTIGDCVTNLLFPFISNQVGFDTSIQIANTTANALAFGTGNGASAQNGTCQLTFYPTDLTTQTATSAGNNGTVVQATTPIINSGGVYSFLQSTSTFANQSGYMYAVCRFLDAHGFSFVINGNTTTATISQGLLALVIQNENTRLPAGPYSGPAGNYEALGH